MHMTKETFEIEVGGKTLTVKLTDWAQQAAGSCLVQYGDTEVLATAVMSSRKSEQDFFPLTVEYEERFYAAGKIFGSRFIKRESRPSDEAILTSRMIDRAIRPLFPKDFKQEVQVIITCLSWDGQNDPDTISMLAASLALSLSNIPWNGPLGALRIAKIGNEFILNPTYVQRAESSLDLTLSAIQDNGQILINMIEMGAKEVSETDVMNATNAAESQFTKLIEFQHQIIKKVGQEKLPFAPAVDVDIQNEIQEFLGNNLADAITNAGRGEKNLGVAESLREELVAHIKEKYPQQGKEKQVLPFFEAEMERII